jgi:hypothetical protein
MLLLNVINVIEHSLQSPARLKNGLDGRSLLAQVNFGSKTTCRAKRAGLAWRGD